VYCIDYDDSAHERERQACVVVIRYYVITRMKDKQDYGGDTLPFRYCEWWCCVDVVLV